MGYHFSFLLAVLSKGYQFLIPYPLVNHLGENFDCNSHHITLTTSCPNNLLEFFSALFLSLFVVGRPQAAAHKKACIAFIVKIEQNCSTINVMFWWSIQSVGVKSKIFYDRIKANSRSPQPKGKVVNQIQVIQWRFLPPKSIGLFPTSPETKKISWFPANLKGCYELGNSNYWKSLRNTTTAISEDFWVDVRIIWPRRTDKLDEQKTTKMMKRFILQSQKDYHKDASSWLSKLSVNFPEIKFRLVKKM